MKNRNTNIDFARGVAILIVMLGHAILCNLNDTETSFLMSEFIGEFQMPLFFLLCGFVAKYSFPSNKKDYNPYVFGIKKIKRLLIPYVTWVTIHYFLVCLIPGNYRTFSILGIFKELIYSDFWFIRYLIVFYVILWLIDIMIHIINIDKNVIIYLCFLVSIFLMFIFKGVEIVNQLVGVKLYSWFVMGFVFNDLLSIIVSNCLKTYNLNYFIVVLMVSLIGITLANYKSFRVPAYSSLLTTNVFLLLICINKKYENTKICKIIQNIGTETLGIYAVHWCLLFSPLWRIDFYNRILNTNLFLSVLITYIIWVIVCYYSVKILKKAHITRLLFLGEKH